jgi:hypothetical protein
MTLITEVGGNLTQWDLTRGPRIEVWLMTKWLSWANIGVYGANGIIRVGDANYVIRFRFQLPQLNWTRRDALESHRSPRSTPGVEDKREKRVLTGPKGTSLHVSAGLVWSLSRLRVTWRFVHLCRTTANWVRRTLAVASRTRESKT